MKKLNLGSGRNYMKGWINCDFSDRDIYGNKIKVDIKQDLDNFPYKIKSNYFDYILLDNVLEHLTDTNKCLSELERISKKGAIVKIIVPHFSYYKAYKDPTHKHYFCLESIDIIVWNKKFKLTKSELQISNNKIINLIGKIITLNKTVYERLLCWIFPVQGIIWELEKV